MRMAAVNTRAAWRQPESGDKNRWPICCQNSKEQRHVCGTEWSKAEEASQSHPVLLCTRSSLEPEMTPE